MDNELTIRPEGQERHDEIVIYQSEDEQVKVDVLFENETVWLTMDQMCQLFGKAKSTISEHIKHIFEDGELQQDSVVRFFRTTASDGKEYLVSYFNLDVIISVGYRVHSHQGTQFRIWATQRLKDYIIKGVALREEEHLESMRELEQDLKELPFDKNEK